MGRPRLLALAIAIAAVLLWSTPVLFPLKILVVLLHEVSHGLAALATGGSIERITVSADQGGLCVTRGGSRLAVLNAGYVGSLAWGAGLLWVGARSRWDRQVLGALGIAMLLVTLLWVRSLFGFGFGLVMGAALFLAGWKLRESVADVLVSAIGVTSCLYAVWDIGSDVLARTVPGSDASALAELTGIPALVWGVLWIALSIATVGLVLWAAGGPEVRAAASAAAGSHGSRPG